MVFFIFKNWDPKTLHQKPLSPLDDLFPFRKNCVQSRKKKNLPISSVPLLWSPLLHKKTGDHRFGHFFARSHRQQNCKSPRCMGSSSKSLASPWISRWFSTPRQIYGSKMLGEMNRKNPIFGELNCRKFCQNKTPGGMGFWKLFGKTSRFLQAESLCFPWGGFHKKHMANSHGEFHPHVADAIHGIPLPNMWRSIFGGSFHTPL